MLPFDRLGLTANLLVFAGAALVVWLAGTRLARYADEIANRTGAGRALIGALLLGGITSLPEAATVTAASVIGNAPLAVNNIFGGVAMQVAILGLADVVLRGGALSSRVRQPAVLHQGVLLLAVLVLAAVGIAIDDVLIFGAGIWAMVVLGGALLAFALIHRFGNDTAWQPESLPGETVDAGRTGAHERRNAARDYSAARIGLSTAAAAGVILAAGFVLARSGDVVAEQSGLGSSFVGVLFLAIATSLPEISTTLAAVRLGEYTMAYSNIFGANILDLAIIALADVAYPGGPVLNALGRFSLVGALLGMATTAACLIGLLLRRKRVVLGAGLDSLAVLAVYAAGMALLYSIRQ